jgi:hypothetical protein
MTGIDLGVVNVPLQGACKKTGVFDPQGVVQPVGRTLSWTQITPALQAGITKMLKPRGCIDSKRAMRLQVSNKVR